MDRKNRFFPPNGTGSDPDPELLRETTKTLRLDDLLNTPFFAEDSESEQLESSPTLKLIRTLAVPIILIARSHSIKFANAAFRKIVRGGFSLKNATFSSLFPNPREAREAQKLLETVFLERKPQIRERILQVYQNRIWARIHLHHVMIGQDPMVMMQIENLTAQKQLLAVQKYKRLVNLFPMGIAELALNEPLYCGSSISDQLDGILNAWIVDGNDNFAEMYNRRQINELLGIRLGTLLPSEGKSRRLYEKWIKSRFPITFFETKEITVNKGNLYFENTLIGHVSHGRLLGFWWLKRDISDKKRTEKEILKAQKLESLGILAGGIAHDFNNLLTCILGNITLAQNFVGDEHRSSERLKFAAEASSRAQVLTRQLLTFSQGGAPIKKTGSIAELLTDSVTFALRGSNVRCEFSLPDNLWPTEMDEGQINQVIHNLVINAIQAMPQGGSIFIHGSNVEIGADENIALRSGNYVKISFRDTGSGIPKRNLSRIFDPYFTTKEKGSGLGLATCYSVIKKHDGLLNVSSELGVGTEFSFYLPASEPVNTISEPRKDICALRKPRILIMDDEKLIRDLASELLQAFGFDTELANDGSEAITLYEQALKNGNRFDLVLMDLTIPGGMGGKEAIRRLLLLDPGIRAVVSSGYCNDPVMADYESYGFLGILPKPYNIDQLTGLLKHLFPEHPMS